VLLILLPLVIGYLVPLSSARLIKLVNQSLGKMVYLILFLMGLGLAYVENLGSNLAVIFKVAGVMLAAITRNMICIFVEMPISLMLKKCVI
jgi:uncharacterized membrane protein YbjE (DUF340 family)